MGSPTLAVAKPQEPMDRPKEIFQKVKNFLKPNKKDKNDTKAKKEGKKPEVNKGKNSKNENNVKNEAKTAKNEANAAKNEAKAIKNDIKGTKEEAVANIVNQFKHFDITPKETKKEELKKQESTEDESADFNFTVIDDDRKRHSSEDSGYSETKEDQEIINAFGKLKIEQKEKKAERKNDKKKKQKVLVARAPIRAKVSDYNADPYNASHQSTRSTLNPHALCGGSVTVNVPPRAINNEVPQIETIHPQTTDADEILGDLMDVIRADKHNYHSQENYQPNNLLELQQKTAILKDLQQIDYNTMFDENLVSYPEESIYINQQIIEATNNILSPSNFMEEMTQSPLAYQEEQYGSSASHQYTDGFNTTPYLTPPRSENVPSPISETQASFYSPNSGTRGNLTPERSSPNLNSGLEDFQEIFPFADLSPISDNGELIRQRNNSVTSLKSTMTLKNFKDMMKEICGGFTKMDCCQVERKSCQELFDDHMGTLTKEQREHMSKGAAELDLKDTYGVLQNILLRLSSNSDAQDSNMALFVLVCNVVLGKDPAAFTGQYGLEILKAVVMRCSHRPMLTRFVVNFVYRSLRHLKLDEGRDCVFDEVDLLGDNLLISLVRSGDGGALALAELTRAYEDKDSRTRVTPLFRLHHANNDGYTALHVACNLHTATSPRLHTLHVLLEHAGADLWKGDMRGGDTALHLAVNSPHCDLRVILMIFKQIDRKIWKKLAHCHNRSSVSPLEYARSAIKSTTRQNYPQEVYEFLKKCR